VTRAARAFPEAGGTGALQVRPRNRPTRLTDVIELGLPYAVKARHDELARALEQVVDGTEEGKALLDGLELGRDVLEVKLGGSLPGHATYCQELMSTAYTRQLAEEPPATLFCDNRAFARGLAQTCAGFQPRPRFFDNGARLAALRVPALVFAGSADPITPFEPTARTAALLPGATFVLIDGGHSPFKEGGKCLADVVDRFARGDRTLDPGCFRAPQEVQVPTR
jgi:pimeloyl-ACP methyl ester carboxylesterase